MLQTEKQLKLAPLHSCCMSLNFHLKENIINIIKKMNCAGSANWGSTKNRFDGRQSLMGGLAVEGVGSPPYWAAL